MYEDTKFNSLVKYYYGKKNIFETHRKNTLHIQISFNIYLLWIT